MKIPQLWPCQPKLIYEVPQKVLDFSKWSFQIKKNGWREIIRCKQKKEIEYFTRAAQHVSHNLPWLANVIQPPFLLDCVRMSFPEYTYCFIIDARIMNGLDLLTTPTLPFHSYAARHEFIQQKLEKAASNNGPFRQLSVDPEELDPNGRFYGCDAHNIFVYEPTGQIIALLSLIPSDLWDMAWKDLDETDPDGPNKGIIFKKSALPLEWRSQPSIEDSNQLKLVKKYGQKQNMNKNRQNQVIIPSEWLEWKSKTGEHLPTHLAIEIAVNVLKKNSIVGMNIEEAKAILRKVAVSYD